MMEQWLNERDKSIVTHVLLGIAHVHTSCITGSQPSDLLLCSLSNCTPLAPRLLVASLAVWMQFHAKSAGHSSTSKKADLMRTVTDQCGTKEASPEIPDSSGNHLKVVLFWSFLGVLYRFTFFLHCFLHVRNCIQRLPTKLYQIGLPLCWPVLTMAHTYSSNRDFHGRPQVPFRRPHLLRCSWCACERWRRFPQKHTTNACGKR